MKKLVILLFLLPMGLWAQTKLDPIMIKPGMLTVTELRVNDENTKLYVDAEGNLIFKDNLAGEKKLIDLVSGNVEHDETITGAGTIAEPLGVNTATIASKADLSIFYTKTDSDGRFLQSIQTDTSLSGDGTTGNPLSVIGGNSNTPGGISGQLQFNDGGNFGGFGVYESGNLSLDINSVDFTAEDIVVLHGNEGLEIFGANSQIELEEGRAVSFQKIEYGANYSANYTDRSLVDKAYVDNVVATGGGTSNSVQALIGNSPAWNANNGSNATITLSGNTTITFSNLSAGQTGNLTVSNSSTAYSLGFSGYTVVISPFIHSAGDEVTTSGNSLIDCFSWYYDGARVIINGTLGYQ